MEKFGDYGDDRQKGFCVHCGDRTESMDHAPSKVFLDLPHPPHMPSLPSCRECNNGFSADEEYVACFTECIICGTSDPELLSRDKVKRAMRRNGSLRARIERAHRESKAASGGTIHVWRPEAEAVRRVVLKLARCHAAYELNEPRLDEPEHVLFMPLISLTDDQRRHFETAPEVGVSPEVGSRAMQRVLIADDSYAEGWLTVQDGRYRFLAVAESSLMVRGVISEYLAFEVIWE
ncbi:hypothetical protein [Paracoccus sp. S3-43]|uniref:hypothetical protein n=1 Tax=Paracoccus sp. S3-43 TaxID=3030011 RepID=UPI0023B00123|nr:hypothetical protein [Paracoccus sp. S3-43]WEF24780.1 hypothetical protein PXD02_02150 [Paracoccus sp. S3-43]